MFRHLCAAFVAMASLGGLACALDSVNPGSLLIYPEFDNSPGRITLLSITNTSPQDGIGAHLTYVDAELCELFDRIEVLTPNDTLTVLTSAHNPQHQAGFVYAAAVETVEHQRVLHNWLIGTSRFIDGFSGGMYSLQPFTYFGIDPTDNGNGLIDLDGVEYEQAAAELLIPSFVGYRPQMFESDLILIGLSGGAQFQTRVDFLIYNDNEEVFSTSYTFKCWDKVATENLSPAFLGSFLSLTDDDPDEVFGVPGMEAGWFRVQGNVATSPTTSIVDPAILVALVQQFRDAASGDLPFGVGLNDNGKLWPMSVDGQF